jgi:DNA-binding XRE family transcriptional regulator
MGGILMQATKAAKKSIGERLKECRESEGLFQYQLASKLKVSQQAVQAYEKNKRKPSWKVMQGYCDLFNKKMDDLFS